MSEQENCKRGPLKAGSGLDMDDIARMAGVSKTTVSNAINNKPLVSEETKRRILDICEKTGYKVNLSIQDIVRESKNGSTRNIAYFLVESEFSEMSYSGFIPGLSRAANEFGYNLVIVKINKQVDSVSALPPVIRDGRCDGIVMTGKLTKEISALIDTLGKPYVILGTYAENVLRNSLNVSINIRRTMSMIVEQLKTLGKTKIAYFMGHPDNYSQIKYADGYREALEEHGLVYSEELVIKDTKLEGGVTSQLRDAIKSAGKLPFDAIIALDFILAGFIIQLLSARCGFQKELDALVVVSRNSPVFIFSVPAVYVEFPGDECAYLGMKTMIEALKNKTSLMPQQISVCPQITITK